MTGASKNTVVKPLVDAGEACSAHQGRALRDLPCKRIHVDEIWSFTYVKQKNDPEDEQGEVGDIWT